HELARAVVEGGVPVHLFGKGEISQNTREALGQRVGCAPASPIAEDREVRALRRLDPLERVERDALLAREAERRRRGIARRIERGRYRRPHDRLVEVLL